MCAHCGDEMRGYAMAGDRWLCHPDPPHLDCYHLVTVYHHAMAGSTDECDGCSRAVVSAARAQAERWHDGSGVPEDEPHESNYGRVGCAPTRKAPRRDRVPSDVLDLLGRH